MSVVTGATRRLERRLVAVDTDQAVLLRVAALVVAVVVAYHYSLRTLMRTLTVDTPLAYLGLVPVIATVLVAARAHPKPTEVAIADRSTDYIIALPLLVGSLAINLLLPDRLSTLFWLWRVDLLSLPMFVAGAIVMLFGVRALWRVRVGVAFLLLAWPYPYSFALLNYMDGFTNVTLVALRKAVSIIPIAVAKPGGDGSLFTIGHAGKRRLGVRRSQQSCRVHSRGVGVVSSREGAQAEQGLLAGVRVRVDLAPQCDPHHADLLGWPHLGRVWRYQCLSSRGRPDHVQPRRSRDGRGARPVRVAD
jgi:hypothetical protein